jgi:hypothetical protein
MVPTSAHHAACGLDKDLRRHGHGESKRKTGQDIRTGKLGLKSPAQFMTSM